MNSSMTRDTKNSKVFNFIIVMTSINVMNFKLFFRFLTDKTLFFIKRKSSFSVKPRSLSVVWIFFSRPLKSIECYLFASFGTKLRSLFSRSFSFKNILTNLTSFRYFCIPFITRRFPAISRTKVNCSRFLFCNITRPFKKFIKTIFTNEPNQLVTRFFVTRSGAKFCSNFLKRRVACLADHYSSLALATVKNQSQGVQP